jgi:glycosyltransferase involved in cell wall biosynthesis
MRYSVVIATYNRAESLLSTLRSLSEVHLIETTEVVIVDNNSNDHTKDIVAKAMDWFPGQLRYVFEPEQGRSAALNSGIRTSAGETILISDDDVRFDSNWICAAAHALEDPSFDYLGHPRIAGVAPDIGPIEIAPDAPRLFGMTARPSSPQIIRWTSQKGFIYDLYSAANVSGPWTVRPECSGCIGSGLPLAFTNGIPSLSSEFYRVLAH